MMGIVYGRSSYREPSWYDDSHPWRTECKSDPRFAISGYTHGKWDVDRAAREALDLKARELGVPVPADARVVTP